MDGNGGSEPQPRIIITVRADRKGVDVRGPLANRELCWRMLTDAASAILNYRGTESGLIVPEIVLPSDVLGPKADA